MATEILDVTRVMRPGMAVFPGDPAYGIEPVSSVRPGEPGTCSVARLEMSTHCGTHVDAPAHFVAGGATIEQIPLVRLCVPARLVDFREQGPALGVEALEGLDLDGVSGLLIRTAGDEDPSEAPFDPAYAHLTPEAASWIVDDSGLGLVGIDTPSVEAADSEGLEVHHRLLEAEPPIVIVENLDLRFAAPGVWDLTCLPLRLDGADGAPARAFLRRR